MRGMVFRGDILGEIWGELEGGKESRCYYILF